MTHVRVIAEAGSNHNGNLATAALLIDNATQAGADYIKFQHYPDTRYGPWPMPVNWLIDLNNHAQRRGIGFMCSVFDTTTLNEYVQCVPDAPIKIASPELTHHDLLRAAAKTGREVIVSTGMSTPEQLTEAFEILYDLDGHSLTVLHCVSSYPAPPNELNLNVFAGSHWFDGLSDHTLDPVLAPVMAVALGATTIEKHFTLDKSQDGPDHSYALNPNELKQMVNAIRTAQLMLGDGVKRVMPSEDPTARRTPEWRTVDLDFRGGDAFTV